MKAAVVRRKVLRFEDAPFLVGSYGNDLLQRLDDPRLLFHALTLSVICPVWHDDFGRFEIASMTWRLSLQRLSRAVTFAQQKSHIGSTNATHLWSKSTPRCQKCQRCGPRATSVTH